MTFMLLLRKVGVLIHITHIQTGRKEKVREALLPTPHPAPIPVKFLVPDPRAWGYKKC